MNKIVVYTCIIGDYDTLKPVMNQSSRIDYICFTDNLNLKSDGVWQIRPIPEDDMYTTGLDPVKKQRIIKILPQLYLSEYDISIWIDGSIQITGNLIFEFLNELDLNRNFLYINRHPSRDCIYREEVEVLRRKKDIPQNTNPQIKRYKNEGFPEHFGLAETNIIVRKHNDFRCKKLMFDWAKEIITGSHRDQLSFDYCRWKNGVTSYIGWLEENLHYTSKSSCFRIYSHGSNPVKLIGKIVLPQGVIHKYEIDEKQKLEEEKKKLEDENRKLKEEQEKKEEELKQKFEEEKQKLLEEQEQKIQDLEDKQEELETKKEETDLKLDQLKEKLETTKNQLKALEELNRKFNELNKKYDLEKVNSEKIIEKFKTDKEKLLETIESLKSSIKKEKLESTKTKLEALEELNKKFNELNKKYDLEKVNSEKIIEKFKTDKEKLLETIELLKGKEKEENNNQFPILSIVITTHNRTNCTCACIQELINRIKYKGSIKWIIADDRSDPNHLKKISMIFLKNGIADFEIVSTNKEHYGQAASLNNGLRLAFSYSDFVLRTEDDWYLKEDLNMTYMIGTMLKDKSICGIRLGALPPMIKKRPYKNDRYFDELYSAQKIFNFQVMLCRKSIYDKLGFYTENISGQNSEEIHQIKYRELISKTALRDTYKLLVPNRFKTGTLDDPSLFFIHVGISVSGHRHFGCPERYMNIYNNRFTIITAAHNAEKTIERCKDSIVSQTYQEFEWIIIDDQSEDDTYRLCRRYEKEFKDKVFVFRNRGKGMAAAWNTGLDHVSSSTSYILFLDSDDYYLDNNVLADINKKIIENDNIDCILLSYFYEFYNKNISFKTNDLDEAILVHSSAPWSKCIKSSIYAKTECHFKEGKRCCNDTIQDLMLFKNIQTVESISRPLIFYGKSSPTSIWNNLTPKGKIPEERQDAILAVKDTINDLTALKFNNKNIEFVKNRRLGSLKKYL